MQEPISTADAADLALKAMRKGDAVDFSTMRAWEREKGDTFARGRQYGYDDAVIYDVVIATRDSLTLAKAGIAEA